jgi:hypothetical protein
MNLWRRHSIASRRGDVWARSGGEESILNKTMLINVGMLDT